MLPETIKILLTGQAGLKDAIDAINLGGLNLYVEKPWNMEEIHVDIERLILRYRDNVENHRLLRRLEARVRELEEQVQEIESQN
jgi:two-component system chemotaxis response regulator CheY